MQFLIEITWVPYFFQTMYSRFHLKFSCKCGLFAFHSFIIFGSCFWILKLYFIKPIATYILQKIHPCWNLNCKTFISFIQFDLFFLNLMYYKTHCHHWRWEIIIWRNYLVIYGCFQAKASIFECRNVIFSLYGLKYVSCHFIKNN